MTLTRDERDYCDELIALGKISRRCNDRAEFDELQSAIDRRDIESFDRVPNTGSGAVHDR